MGAKLILLLWCSTGNGYIEGKELENFFKELETARRGAGVVSVCCRSTSANTYIVKCTQSDKKTKQQMSN